VFWTVVIGVPSLLLTAAGIAVSVILSRRSRRRARREVAPLLTFRDFYGDEIDDRHQYRFVPERDEIVMREGKPEVEKRTPLETILGFVDGGGQLLVLAGEGGLGKSRLLIEAAKQRPKLRFAATRTFSADYAALAELIAEKTDKGAVVVFDDCHEYAGDFGALLSAALRAGARVIASCRYPESIEPALQRCHCSPVALSLRLMANAVQVVPAQDEQETEAIARASEFNPALAVMAFNHLKETGSLKGIADRLHLLEQVFADMVRVGEAAGFKNAREFLGELAVRAGLFEDEEPVPSHLKLVTALLGTKQVGFVMRGERRLYGIHPDMLRDYIIRDVFCPRGVLQPEFDAVLTRMPDSDAENVIGMLAIQFRETGDEAWKQAGRKVLRKFEKLRHEKGIGFTAEQSLKALQQLIDVGYEAWQAFGDVHMVREVLGDFCAGAEKLESVEHVNKAGLFYMDTGEPDRALVCFERGLALAEKAVDEYVQAVFLGNIGLIWQQKGELDKALDYHEKALAIDRAGGFRREEAQALGNIGLIWQDRGELDKALEYQEKALAIDRAGGFRREEAQDRGNIGLIWQDRGELDKALECFEDGMRIQEEIGDSRGVASKLGNIGLIWQDRGELDKALECHEKALAIAEALGDRAEQARQLGNIGNMFARMMLWARDGHPEPGTEKAERFLDSLRSLGMTEGARAVVPLAEMAVPRLVKALGMFMEMGIADGPRQCLWGLGECLKAMGRDRFVAACVKTEMSEKDAKGLADGLEQESRGVKDRDSDLKNKLD